MENPAREFIAGLKGEFEPLRQAILGHRFIAEAADGKLPREKLHRFVQEQVHIIRGDFRNIALYLARAEDLETQDLFLGGLSLERQALEALPKLAEGVGVSWALLEGADPAAGAFAFTNYFCRLGVYGSAGEVAAALAVDLDVWGENCRRLSEGLRRHYGLLPERTEFLDFFYPLSPEFEAKLLAVVGKQAGLPDHPQKMRIAAKLALEYELMFWDTVYR